MAAAPAVVVGAARAGKSWADLLDAWLKLVPADGHFEIVDGHVTTLDDLTAAEYVNSDRLDLDHVWTGAESRR